MEFYFLSKHIPKFYVILKNDQNNIFFNKGKFPTKPIHLGNVGTRYNQNDKHFLGGVVSVSSESSMNN